MVNGNELGSHDWIRHLPKAELHLTWSQGAPRCHADVTLRLETPVLTWQLSYAPTLATK